MVFRFLSVFLLVLIAAPVAADPLTAAQILSGEEITLSDGRVLRLEGIKAPFAETRDLAEQARGKLQDLAKGKELILTQDAVDRYGRITAQAYTIQKNQKAWLQDEMLRAGLAFAYPLTGQEQNLDTMLQLETEARRARRGIWADLAYADIPATHAEPSYGSFAFVSGTVADVARVKNRLYINFGENWREDFTVAIAAKDLRLFRKAKIDPMDYKGQTIRVRGWVKREGGPMITVNHPAQIEIVKRIGN